MTPEAFAAFMGTVSTEPGVYLFKDADQRVIYVGKAVSLRSRLRSYTPGPASGGTRSSSSAPSKSSFIGGQAASVDTIVTRSDLEALMLEQTLIQKYHPRYNISFRDNKSYPVLELTAADPFPRLYFTRKHTAKGSRVYGPYTGGAARRLQRVVNQYFRIPSCRVELDGKQTPCLYHHLNWCDAPCAGRIGTEDYAKLVTQARLFLDGRGAELVPQLQHDMEDAAAREDFETAVKLRDRLKATGELLEDQAVIAPGDQTADVLGLARSGSFACLVLLAIRGGKLSGKQEFTVRRAADTPDGELITAFLGQHFAQAVVPARLLLPCEIDDQDVVARWLESRRGLPVEVLTPQRGHNRELLELALANAKAALVSRGRVGEDEAQAQQDEARVVLGLERAPRRLEAVDLSRLGGEEAVGAVVVFRDGLPSRQEYRKFLIKTAPGDDDYAGMEEVIFRRLKRMKDEGTAFPDLLLLDGGPGQLHAAELAAAKAGVTGVAMVALAKREELLYLPGRPDPVKLPEDSPALHLLQRARDEVHRYVNAYQRTRRAMDMRAGAKVMMKARKRMAAGAKVQAGTPSAPTGHA